MDALTPQDTESMLVEVLPPRLRETFDSTHEADFAYQVPGVGRFRSHAYRSRGSVAMVFRRVAEQALTLQQLDMPATIEGLATEPRGLVLVTGPTGSGKTTTLAAMVDYINEHREVNIVTIEDPIEFLHRDKKAIISQREIGADTIDFNSAMRAAMRQDPDVILVGEMRDAETVRAALQAGETGHLVLSTLHTIDAEETINRIVDFFPSHEQTQIRMALAQSLRGIISQRLVSRDGGSGRIAAAEIMINTGRTQEAIVNPAENPSITDLIADGGYYNMQTFDQHLFELVRTGIVSYETAIAASTAPQDLNVLFRSAGIVQ